jgi:lectin-like protein
MGAAVGSARLSAAERREWAPPSAVGGFAGGGGGGAVEPLGGNATTAPSAGQGGSDGVVADATLPLPGGGGVASDVGIDDADGVGGLGADAGVNTGGEPFQACADGVSGPEGSGCYRVVLAPASWPGARDQCAAWGGALVKVETAEEDAFLEGLAPVSQWLGGSDTVFENVFLWTDGTPITYGNWGMNQPDRFPGPDCVEKRNPLTNRLWYDQPCTNALAFVCEKPLAAP